MDDDTCEFYDALESFHDDSPEEELEKQRSQRTKIAKNYYENSNSTTKPKHGDASYFHSLFDFCSDSSQDTSGIDDEDLAAAQEVLNGAKKLNSLKFDEFHVTTREVNDDINRNEVKRTQIIKQEEEKVVKIAETINKSKPLNISYHRSDSCPNYITNAPPEKQETAPRSMSTPPPPGILRNHNRSSSDPTHTSRATPSSMRDLIQSASRPDYKPSISATYVVDPMKPPSPPVPTTSSPTVKSRFTPSLLLDKTSSLSTLMRKPTASVSSEEVEMDVTPSTEASSYIIPSPAHCEDEATIQRSNISTRDMELPAIDDEVKKPKRTSLSKKNILKSINSKLVRSNKPSSSSFTTLPTELPPNAVPIRCSSSIGQDSMLLLSEKKEVHKGPIWCMKFSLDGQFLASAGEDHVILVFLVGKEERGEKKENVDGKQLGADGHGSALGCEIELLSTKPHRRYDEHTSDIIDLSWSRTNFLLSASLDKTVRLWHISRNTCLHIFQHTDLVTCVDFHPVDESIFLSGGFDKKLRVWSIPQGRVQEWAQTPEIITAARFTPSAMFVVAGLIQGQVYLYLSEGLRYYTQISCRNRHGKSRVGKKVTGLSFGMDSSSRGEEGGDGLPLLPPSDHGGMDQRQNSPTSTPNSSLSSRREYLERASTRSALRLFEQLLVTTNDSRLRLFGLDDYCMITKYKGLVNQSMQIKAHFSEEGNDIICGSEVGNVYMWKKTSSKRGEPQQPNNQNQLSPYYLKSSQKYHRNKYYEWFEATSIKNNLPIVTDALFVPTHSTECALLRSRLFPTLERVGHVPDLDLSNVMVVTSDYEGTIRVFLRKSALDQVLFIAGPEGFVQ